MTDCFPSNVRCDQFACDTWTLNNRGDCYAEQGNCDLDWRSVRGIR